MPLPSPASPPAAIALLSLDAAGLDQHLEALADILRACVHDGASVNFILPFDMPDARAFWHTKVAGPLAAGHRVLLAATVDGVIAGTVQLNMETPPNQAHRADVSKLLVHPRYRRLGIARALMQAIEAAARDHGRWLLTLDTASGPAEQLYTSLGYRVAGCIPGYARHPTEKHHEAATFLYKVLSE